MEEVHQNEMKWRVCPAQLQPWKGACAWFVIVAVGVTIIDTNLYVGISSLVFMLIALAPFIFPSNFIIDAEGIHAKYPLTSKYYTWDQVRRAIFFKDSCALFTRKKPSSTGPGMRIFFNKQADNIVIAIKSHLREDVAT